MNEKLTHFDEGGQAWMVDVGAKDETARRAVAAGVIRMRPETLALVRSGTAKKGDVLGVARIAAIQAAKRTWELIPLCHPVALTAVEVAFRGRRGRLAGGLPRHGGVPGPHGRGDGGPHRRERRRSSRSTTCARPWTAG